MKDIFSIFIAIFVCCTAKTQMSVYDGDATNYNIVQSEKLKGKNELINQGYIFLTSSGKNVNAAGPLDFGAEKRVALKEKSLYDVAVMNYPDLNNIQKFKKIEFGIDLEGEIEDRIKDFLANPYPARRPDGWKINPFLDWEIDIDATFYHAISNTTKQRDFFYYHEFERDVLNDDWVDVINLTNNHIMRVRFAPPEAGLWETRITIKINNEIIAELPSFNFNVEDNSHPGYVYVHENKRNLKRGEKLILPVGHVFPGPYKGNNIWYDPNNIPDLNKTAGVASWGLFHSDVARYVENGGRYIKTVETPYGSLLEFAELGNYFNRMHAAWEMDQFMNLCEEQDVMIHFNLLFQTPIDRYGDTQSRWDYGPYNADGTIDKTSKMPDYAYYVPGTLPSNMFNDELLLNYHKQRTRYYVSRYGYSPQIYTWEIISEPFHLDGLGSTKPALNNSPETEFTVASIDNYHNEIADYINLDLKDTDHLITIQQWYQDTDFNDPRFYNSAKNDNIDIIGWNVYDDRPDELVISKIDLPGGNNSIHVDEESMYKKIRATQGQPGLDKPILFTELGSHYNQFCSFYLLHYTDIMTHGFSGIAGICTWHGFADAYMDGFLWQESNLWESTIRTQQHMDGQDVTNVLNRSSGNWIQGRQEARAIKKDNGDPSKELQYYVAQDKADAVGYLMNRTYNLYSSSTKCPPGVAVESPNHVPFDINWKDGKNKNALYVEGLEPKTWYRTAYYDYVNGATIGGYLSTICFKTNAKGQLKLKEYPDLTVSQSVFDSVPVRPIIWFVTAKGDCKNSVEPDALIEPRK